MPAVTVSVAVTVEVSGTRVMVEGTPVQMPGFWGKKSAQMPARYDRAAVISVSDVDQAETQSCTFAIKSADGQKHA